MQAFNRHGNSSVESRIVSPAHGAGIKNGVGLLSAHAAGYRTDGGVGWLAGARFS